MHTNRARSVSTGKGCLTMAMRNEHFAILQKEVKVAARVVAEDCNRAMVRNMELVE